ncbi:unnamed protein product [Periconia digitata]|uniref:Uncharacterized protein n=1 Tax=Periconia digitata TaxID=1303443 RepID=A0A9W4U706_9PLEO|nr:unnamed protein product [Periconia digitata]
MVHIVLLIANRFDSSAVPSGQQDCPSFKCLHQAASLYHSATFNQHIALIHSTNRSITKSKRTKYTMRIQPRISILDFPAEIRNRIYHFVFVRESIRFRVKGPAVGEWDTDEYGDKSNFRETVRTNAPPLYLSLLRTCRQIYQEARLVPLAGNVLDINDATVLASLDLLSLDQKAAVATVLAPVSLDAGTGDMIPNRTEQSLTLLELVKRYSAIFPNLLNLVVERHFRVVCYDGSVDAWEDYCLTNGLPDFGYSASPEDFKAFLRERHDATARRITETAFKNKPMMMEWPDLEVHYMEHYDWEGPDLVEDIGFMERLKMNLETCFCYRCHVTRVNWREDYTYDDKCVYTSEPSSYPYYIGELDLGYK